MPLHRRVARLAAVLVAAAGLAAVPVAAEAQASCSGTTGTIVVVDFNQLVGGGSDISKGCAPDAETAADAFRQAGYSLGYSPAPGMQGFVCTVNAKPADRDCTGADAYWSLWWADGKGGSWVYASRGADSLDAPQGGYVAFSWHEGSGSSGTPPGVNPTKRVASTPSPSPTTGSGSGSGTKSSGGRGSSATPTAKATESASASASASASPTPRESASPSASDATPSASAAASSETTSSALPEIDEITAAPPAADEQSRDEGGFPAWVGIVLAVVVLGAAGAVPILRRRAH